MHAPASNFRKGEPIPYAKRLIRLTKDHELHFVTGHGHRHFTADIIGNVIEQEFTQSYNWNAGSGLSLVLMLFIVISMAIIAKYDKDGEGTAF
jgi:hypothetical protein